MKLSPFVLVVLGVSALVLVALIQLSEILLPFVLGFTLAYCLDPLADRLERVGMPRLMATNVITFAFGFAVLAGLFFGLPALAAELGGMVERIPAYTRRLEGWMAGNAVLSDYPDAVNTGIEAVRGVSGLCRRHSADGPVGAQCAGAHYHNAGGRRLYAE